MPDDENMLVKAIQAKTDETQKAIDLFKQMHQMMHDEMDKPEEEVPMVRPESSPVPS